MIKKMLLTLIFKKIKKMLLTLIFKKMKMNKEMHTSIVKRKNKLLNK